MRSAQSTSALRLASSASSAGGRPPSGGGGSSPKRLPKRSAISNSPSPRSNAAFGRVLAELGAPMLPFSHLPVERYSSSSVTAAPASPASSASTASFTTGELRVNSSFACSQPPTPRRQEQRRREAARRCARDALLAFPAPIGRQGGPPLESRRFVSGTSVSISSSSSASASGYAKTSAYTVLDALGELLAHQVAQSRGDALEPGPRPSRCAR